MDYLQLALEGIQEHSAGQYSTELARMLEIAHYLNPQKIVEIGVDRSGLSWTLLQVTSPKSYDAIDPVPKHLIDGVNYHRLHSYNVADSFSEIDLLIIDGDHSGPVAKADWEMYAPKVVQDGVIFFCDINQAHLWDLWQTLKTRVASSKELIQEEDEVHIGNGAGARPGHRHAWGGIGVAYV